MQTFKYRSLCRISLIAGLALLMTACSTDSKKSERREAYIDAGYYERLALPPDLTDPSFSKALIVPEPGEKAKQRYQQQVQHLQAEDSGEQAPVTTPTAVAPAVVMAGAAISTDGKRRWLELKQDVSEIWGVIASFLMQEGLPVVRQEAQIGLMETDWVAKYQIPDDAGFFAKAFSKLEPDMLDRFTFRIERATDAAVSRVYITHAGLERIVAEDDINWISRNADTSLEAEMLQRLALYVGAARVEASYRPFAIRVRDSADIANSIEIVGDSAFVEQRVRQALQALEITKVEPGASSGELLVTLDKDSGKLAEVEELDEIAQSSVIMQMFSGKSESDISTFMLRLTELEHHTRLDFNDVDGDASDTVLAEQLSLKLKQQLI